jgi:DNA repair protein RecN (Recombination protein N)
MGGAVSKKSAVHRSLLEEIDIRGLGVIDNAIVEFAPGFNVITGETGAGKTMLLTALSLILGDKADSDLIRFGHERLSVSGRFSLPGRYSEKLKNLCEEHDPSIEEGSILLARQVTKDGKSRAQLSGATTTAATLGEFGSELIEVHGQHGNLVLSKANKQRELLDSAAGETLLESHHQYQRTLAQFQELKRTIAELKKSLQDRDREISSLKELSVEYSKIKPKEGELDELDALISRLESVEDLRVAATGAQQALSDEDSGGLNSLQHSKRFLQGARGKDQQLDSINEKVCEALYTLIDAASDIDRYIENLSADPSALENALQRKALITSFTKRFGSSGDKYEALSEAIERAKSAEKRIADLTGGDDRVAELESELVQCRRELMKKGKDLTRLRIDAASSLSKTVTAELHLLAMPKAIFDVKVESRSGENDGDFQSYGLDEVAMLFTSHGAGELLPISKAASGGELSRLMLALEVVIAERYPLGTYVFDEVDAGVGGKAALEVGRRLRKLAQSSQVIVVTHLAQVALWADNHIVVEKDTSGAIRESSIRRISDHDREVEIARMLSGVENSEHAQEHARELLDLRITEKA